MHKDDQKNIYSPMLQFRQGVNLTVFPPLLSRELFASFTGASIDTVRGWAQTYTIPTVKMGRQRLINIAKLIKDLENGKTNFRQGDYGEEAAG